MSTPIVGARPIMIAPEVNNTSAIRIVFFLPILSEIGPAVREPKAAPSVASETIV
jgi:hypothetical protein